jgi:hypothetical protein
MIGMFMGDEYRPDIPYRQSQPHHPALGFPAGYSGIDQHSICTITEKVAITIASGIE